MIKILKPGTRKRIQCEHCSAILSYEEEDICDTQQEGPIINCYMSYKYIKCPQCGQEVTIESVK